MLPLLLRRRAISKISCNRYTHGLVTAPAQQFLHLRRLFAAIAICDDSSASRQCDSSHKARLPCQIAHVPSAHAHAHAPSLFSSPSPEKWFPRFICQIYRGTACCTSLIYSTSRFSGWIQALLRVTAWIQGSYRRLALFRRLTWPLMNRPCE